MTPVRNVLASLVLGLTCLLAVPTASACVSSNNQLPTFADSMYFFSNSALPSWVGSATDGGISMWGGCWGIPDMYRGSAGDIPVEIRYELFSDFGCAEVQRYPNSYGGLLNAVLTVYEYDVNGNSCSSHGDSTMAHEIGHLMGMSHSQCAGYIMSYSSNRSVQPSECDFANQSFETTEERNSKPGTGTGSGCDDPQLADTCDSPIVIDLDGRGVAFSDREGGVLFDIDADGVFEKVAWTRAGGDEAFLALDRNGNGRIDDSMELFGNRTPQEESDQPNGFLALAEFDRIELGGNADGWITPEDAIFPFLRLWTDEDHDAQVDPGELNTLEQHGVAGLSLLYRRSERRDRYGNRLRYSAQVLLRADGERPYTHAVDVFLRVYDPLDTADSGAP